MFDIGNSALVDLIIIIRKIKTMIIQAILKVFYVDSVFSSCQQFMPASIKYPYGKGLLIVQALVQIGPHISPFLNYLIYIRVYPA